MSACAPKQLGACLPQIVPRLSETLIDTHPKVVEAATWALKAIGEVIRNPEIQALSSYLLGAIAKPAELTLPCLEVLLETTFVNTVDAPSLALIVPVLSRGLRDRKADLKKKAAKIAGNMCALVADAKDMSPYIPLLLPDIQKALVDPSPEVRATAAAALASLVRGMGGIDEHFAELIPWLTETLQSDGPMTERSGAAQGLAECLAVLGAEHFEAMLPEILAGCHHPAPYVREGHLTLLRFLPLALGQLFEAHLQEALAEVLTGLADSDEPVRDAALGAGRVFVEEFSHSAQSLDLLLPSIEDGISSENWRIRQSAVELLGSMMFRIAGASGKVHVEGGSDDEGVSTEAQGRALSGSLGENRHNDLLAAVYALRSDPTAVVRNAAMHIWKTVVSNTPRTLRAILPRLMERLIAGLSAHNDDRRTTASRCLGELVRKLGERVLPEVFPILRGGLESGGPETREGVCLGLAEVLAAARKDQLAPYYADVVPVIRDALCDPEESVRNAAGSAFDAMFRHGGADTAADIVPALLAKLDTDPVALEGLKQVLRAQPKILASVLPKLASPPINAARAGTLGALAEVAGAALPPHLSLLFPPLLVAMGSGDPEESTAAAAAAAAVIRAVPEEAHYLLLPEIVNGVTDSVTAAERAAAAALCAVFAKEAPCFDAKDDVPQIIDVLFELFIDPDEAAMTAAWTALGEVMGCVAKEDQARFLPDVRKAVDTAREKVRRQDKSAREILIPALCLPKGLAPIVQVYLQGVLSGKHAEDRESAAEGLREAVLSTTTAAIKPHVIPITGPLIRILGDKYPGAVKSAILGALAVMIDKGGLALKPFVPQLQTTFVKCLSDPARAVRQRAAAALGRLMTLQPRVDPLVGDLLTVRAPAD
jgi:HEAT repeat protein